MPPPLEAAEPCSLLDERAAVGRARREDRLDAALADDGACPRAEPDIGEQLDDVRAPHGGAVDQVLALAAAMEAARDRDLLVVEAGERAGRLVEQQLHLAVRRRLTPGRAAEEDVVRTLGAQLARREAAGRPQQRVGDVRLPGAVRPDDDRDTRLEPDLDRIGERLEAANGDRAEIHGRPTLTPRADAAAG